MMADDIQAKIAAVWHSMDASWESYGKILEDKARANTGKVAVRTDHEQMYQLRAQGVTRDTWDREAAGYTLKR